MFAHAHTHRKKGKEEEKILEYEKKSKDQGTKFRDKRWKHNKLQ